MSCGDCQILLNILQKLDNENTTRDTKVMLLDEVYERLTKVVPHKTCNFSSGIKKHLLAEAKVMVSSRLPEASLQKLFCCIGLVEKNYFNLFRESPRLDLDIQFLSLLVHRCGAEARVLIDDLLECAGENPTGELGDFINGNLIDNDQFQCVNENPSDSRLEPSKNHQKLFRFGLILYVLGEAVYEQGELLEAKQSELEKRHCNLIDMILSTRAALFEFLQCFFQFLEYDLSNLNYLKSIYFVESVLLFLSTYVQEDSDLGKVANSNAILEKLLAFLLETHYFKRVKVYNDPDCLEQLRLLLEHLHNESSGLGKLVLEGEAAQQYKELILFYKQQYAVDPVTLHKLSQYA